MEALHGSFVGYLPIRKDCHPTSKCGDRLDCYAGSSITQVIIFRAGVSTKPIRLTERPSNGFALAVTHDKIRVIGALYDIESGNVEFMKPVPSAPSPHTEARAEAESPEPPAAHH